LQEPVQLALEVEKQKGKKKESRRREDKMVDAGQINYLFPGHFHIES